MKKQIKKLIINKATISNLDAAAMNAKAGGATSANMGGDAACILRTLGCSYNNHSCKWVGTRCL